MANKLDPGEKLLAGVVLTVTGLVGLVYRLTGYGMVVGDLKDGYMFYGGSYSTLSLLISAVFMVIAILGAYIVYDTIKKDARIH